MKDDFMMLNKFDDPLIAIVGRPNVGKSQLFNRLTKTRSALVEDLPGTTRDRNYGKIDWRGCNLRIVDTAGLLGDENEELEPLVRRSVEYAIQEADIILFVVSAPDGATDPEYTIASMLRKGDKPCLLIANKSDRSSYADRIYELFGLGMGDPSPISAIHGEGVGDLLDKLVETIQIFPNTDEEIVDQIRIAIVGRPNVGKSSLLNKILGEERTIVSSIAGTTRDAIDTGFNFEDRKMILVDTAGIRRRGKIIPGVERHSVNYAEKSIDRADVVFLLIDQEEPLTAQDTHIAGYVQEQARGLILVVNKWDLSGPEIEKHKFAREIDYKYRFVPWAPVVFTSALTGEGVRDLLELSVHISEVRKFRVQTSELNRIIQRAIAQHGPPTIRHKRLKVMYATQAEITPPTFILFVNDPKLVHFSYQRYLENKIRDAFDFEGTAIRIIFRKRSEDRVED